MLMASKRQDLPFHFISRSSFAHSQQCCPFIPFQSTRWSLKSHWKHEIRYDSLTVSVERTNRRFWLENVKTLDMKTIRNEVQVRRTFVDSTIWMFIECVCIALTWMSCQCIAMSISRRLKEKNVKTASSEREEEVESEGKSRTSEWIKVEWRRENALNDYVNKHKGTFIMRNDKCTVFSRDKYENSSTLSSEFECHHCIRSFNIFLRPTEKAFLS